MIKESTTNKFLSVMKIELSSFTEKITELNRSLKPESVGLKEDGFVDSIDLEAQAIKEETGRVWIEGKVSGTVKLTCDRCLEEFTKDLTTDIRMLFDPNEDESKQEAGTLIIASEELDLGKYLKDSLLLALPSKQLCDPDCKGLCDQCGVNLNRESCECEKDNIDPRLEKFKELKSKMEDE